MRAVGFCMDSQLQVGQIAHCQGTVVLHPLGQKLWGTSNWPSFVGAVKDDVNRDRSKSRYFASR
jgi:hypothetical protein